MDSNHIQLSSDHNQCIINLINKIVTKSPHLSRLKSDSTLYLRLVSVISLIETTLCSKYHIVLKRNSTNNQSIALIKSWLKLYYNQELISSLCRRHQQNDTTEEKVVDETTDGCVDNDSDFSDEDIDRDIGLIALLILFIAHKLRQSLPRIKAYFLPEWQTLAQFDPTLNRFLNFDKLLDLVQNELCIKRKQLEISKSKVLSLQSTINSRVGDQSGHKKTKLDFRSELFAEYEDNNDIEDQKDVNDLDDNEEDGSEQSDGSHVFVDHSSDDDYKPIKRHLHKTPVKRMAKRGSGRGRGRPPKVAKKSIQISPKSSPKSRAKNILKPLTIEGECEEEEVLDSGTDPFVCDTCGKHFAKEYRLVRHSFTHLGHKQFVCDFADCSQSFDLKWKLAEHKTEHTDGADAGGDEDEYGCADQFRCEWADCGQVLATRRELTQHEHQMHANRSQSKYSCDWPQCRDIFDNKVEWRKHVRTHGKIVPTECGYPGCPKTFYKLDSLESHRKVHETFTLDELS